MSAPTEFSNPEVWHAPASNGVGWVLTDPSTRERLNVNTVPSYIEEEPLLRAGIDFMRGRGQDISLTIAYGPHDRADDLGNVAKGWFEHTVQKADYYGYEGMGSDTLGHIRYANNARALLIATIPDGMTLDAFTRIHPSNRSGADGSVGFSARRDRAIALAPTTHSFSYDLPEWNGTPTEQRLHAAYEAIIKHGQGRECDIAFAGLNNAREWIMIARVGVEALKNELGREMRPLDIFMTAGALHRDLTRKARIVGAAVAGKIIKSEEVARIRAGIDIPGMMQVGIILPQEYETLHLLTKDLREWYGRVD